MKDKITVILGIIYCSLIVICWIFGGFLAPGDWVQWYLTLIGLLFLIPSFIFYLIFIGFTKGGTSAALGFALGLPGWGLGLLGRYFKLSFGSFSPYDVPLIICFITLIILGSFLFTRRTKWENPPARTRERTNLILGGIYLGVSSPYLVFGFVDYYLGAWGGPGFFGMIFRLIVAVFLLVSVVFYLVYCRSTEVGISAAAGFGLGIPAWALGLFGLFVDFSQSATRFYDPILTFCFLALIVIGNIIFFRSGKEELPPPPCPECNRALRYIAEENTFYCDHCKKSIAK